jgi:hypothetical protein
MLFAILFIKSTNIPMDLDFVSGYAILEWFLYGDDIGCWQYLEQTRLLGKEN